MWPSLSEFAEHATISISNVFRIPPRGVCRARGSEMRWYLIPGSWYREPFCHPMGPCQTLRAGNWWSQLLVIFRVFFDFNKSRTHLNEVQNFRDMLFLEKRGPCQECTTQKSGVGIVTRIQISRYPDIQISRYPDVQMSGYPDIRYQIPDIRYQVSEK